MRRFISKAVSRLAMKNALYPRNPAVVATVGPPRTAFPPPSASIVFLAAFRRAFQAGTLPAQEMRYLSSLLKRIFNFSASRTRILPLDPVLRLEESVAREYPSLLRPASRCSMNNFRKLCRN